MSFTLAFIHAYGYTITIVLTYLILANSCLNALKQGGVSL